MAFYSRLASDEVDKRLDVASADSRCPRNPVRREQPLAFGPRDLRSGPRNIKHVTIAGVYWRNGEIFKSDMRTVWNKESYKTEESRCSSLRLRSSHPQPNYAPR